MAILPVSVYGDKILREKTKDITNIDGPTILLIQNMFETMRNADGVGLAANQVGRDKSIFVIDVSPVEGFEKYKPMVFINPQIILKSEETIKMEEGCLSLPYLRATVERPQQITIRYMDTDEKIQELEADGYLARVIQHEFDHLIGKVIADRVDPFIKKRIKDELLKIKRRQIDVDYPITD